MKVGTVNKWTAVLYLTLTEIVYFVCAQCRMDVPSSQNSKKLERQISLWHSVNPHRRVSSAQF
jgi:hypothetical protein